MSYLVLFAACCSASSALAQERQDEAPETGGATAPIESEQEGLDEEARMVYQAGVLAYQQGRFENALEHFERAHSLSERPVLLFNIGLAADRLRRDERAMVAYEAYLDAVPDAENRIQVENRLRQLREPAEDHPVAPAPTDGSSPAMGIAVLSLGAASLGASVASVFWWIDRQDVVDQCDARGCANADSVSSERDAAVGVTIGAGAVGLAGVVVGVILLATGGSGPDTAAACSPAPAGIACAGRF